MSESHDASSYLKDAYLGELGGEASFIAWEEVLPERKDSLRLLAEVEAVTARYLRQHLMSEVSEQEAAAVINTGRARALEYAPRDWKALLQSAMPIVEDALIRFEAQERHAPAALRHVYEHFTAHERALVEYFAAELRGENGAQILEAYLATTARVLDQSSA